MTITGKTALYGIIGDPIQHSLSPVMQNEAFAALGIDAIYVPFHVVPEFLGAAVAGLKALSVQGLNVTVPHKEAICRFLDRLDADAELIGAVNTVVRDGDDFVGYNTDGIGLIRALNNDLGIDVLGKNVVMLGAGGAARSALVALARQGVETLTVANRRLERAQQLVDCYQPHFPAVKFTACPLTRDDLSVVIADADLIVNSTSIGLSGESFNVLPWQVVKSECRVYDMVYAAQGTPLVQEARKHGHPCCDGLGMLIGQGEAAFQLWTGQDPGSSLAQALRQL
jgi:shikimate dehydrogenase